VFAVVRWAVNSSPGHVWQAIRENELRVQVLGLKPYTYKLMSYVLASLLATIGGIVYLLLLGGANTDVTTASFTLTLLLMVVIGGTGSRWGAMIGGILYTFANHRLGDLSSSHAVSSLPGVIRTPMQQPLFILGVLFILVVFFVPGGLTRIGQVGVRLDRILRRPAVQEEVT
jgi:branched-chain amino acid transport system permease protein